MIAETFASSPWIDEQRRWQRFYAQRLPAQLRQAATLARSGEAEALHAHRESFFALLNATAQRKELDRLWLDLVDGLHPLPMRWGQWSAWLAILRQAGEKAAGLNRPDRQAGYLAYTADLLLNTGQAENALTSAREAMRLARLAGAAWPLCVACNAASATLRSMARYEAAQALIDEVRAEAAQLDPPRPATRAATVTALLDLEQMDLLRHFKRPEEALTLSRQLIERLSAVEGIDPHDLAHAYLRRATITWVNGRYQEAAAELQVAAALFREAGDPLQATFAEGNLGLVYMSMSRYAEAETFKLAALRAAEEINARKTVMTELGDLSVVYINLGRMERSFECSNRMVELAMEMGESAELSRGRGNRAYALLGLGRYAEAREDLEFSLDHYRQQGRLEGTIVTTVDKIIYLRGVGEEEQAAELAEENYAAAWKEDFPLLRIVTTRCLALFKAPSEQRLLLNQALSLARRLERPMDEAGCLFSLSAITAGQAERKELYGQAVALLRQMGCLDWLDGKSMDDPPLLPMTI